MNDIPYHRIAGQFYNRPLLLTRAAAETVSAFLLSRIGAGPRARMSDDDGGKAVQMFAGRRNEDGSVKAHSTRASRFHADYPVDPGSDGEPAPYRRTAEGTAIVTLVGEFVNRGAWTGASSGLISYEGFKYQMQRAATDPRARTILLDLESPGGEATGAFEAAEMVRLAATVKPVIAVVNGMACSAAYAIASNATRIITMPTGICGSIGVIMMHLDISKYLDDEGIKPSLIFAGDHKADGNPFEPLPADVRAEFQAEISAFYDLFVATVAQGRSGMSEKAIRDTQARPFMGQQAVDVGLADRVGTFETVLAELSRGEFAAA